MEKKGILYPVGTPIGNLKDITLRALEILKGVDLIASEDTRHTRKLLSHYDIHVPLTSLYQHNEIKKTPYLTRRLKDGANVALVSKAGMPGISDPGYSLIKEAIKQGITIVPIPGPAALIVGLVASGLPTHSFVFEGFLGRKKGTRLKKLTLLEEEERTIVIYEAPHRVRNVLSEIREVLGDRQMVIGRELTKKFEEILRGSVSEIEKILEKRKPRGEFTLVIQGKRHKSES